MKGSYLKKHCHSHFLKLSNYPDFPLSGLASVPTFLDNRRSTVYHRFSKICFVSVCYASIIIFKNFLSFDNVNVINKIICTSFIIIIDRLKILQPHFSNLPKIFPVKAEAAATVTVGAVRGMKRLHARHPR